MRAATERVAEIGGKPLVRIAAEQARIEAELHARVIEAEADQELARSERRPERLSLWVHDPDLARAMRERRVNETYFPGFELPETIEITGDLREAMAGAELAVGVPGERFDTVEAAGAVNVLAGTTAGLTGTGSQVFHQGVAGIGSDPETGDFFGMALAVAAQKIVGRKRRPALRRFEVVRIMEFERPIRVCRDAKLPVERDKFFKRAPGIRIAPIAPRELV